MLIVNYVPYVKNFKPILAAHSNILTIKEHTSFGQTYQKIKRSKNADFVLLEKPESKQMLAALLLKIAGRKFFWLQNFSNPPIPSLITKLLVAQADSIMVNDKKDYYKLKSFGINSTKIKYKKFS